VLLEVYDVGGRLVRVLAEGRFAGGEHEVVWEGLDESGHRVAPGVYFCRLKSGGLEDRTKMVVLK